MARPSTSDEPRRPADSVLHRIVQDHLETVVAQAARLRDGDGLPQLGPHSGTRLHRLGHARETVDPRPLVPRPRVNLILYYGVLGARAAWRPEVVPRLPSGQDPVADGGFAAAPDTARRRVRGPQWAELMRRTFEFDVLECPRCGGRLRLLALIEEAAVIGRILRHLGFPPDLPVARPARAPPLLAVAGGTPEADEYESAP